MTEKEDEKEKPVSRVLTVRLQENDYRKLCEVRERDGESTFSSIFRRLIRRRWKTIFEPSQGKMILKMPGMGNSHG